MRISRYVLLAMALLWVTTSVAQTGTMPAENTPQTAPPRQSADRSEQYAGFAKQLGVGKSEPK